jgi:hypothetical protein
MCLKMDFNSHNKSHIDGRGSRPCFIDNAELHKAEEQSEGV